MTEPEQLEKIQNHPVVKMITEMLENDKYYSLSLVGGAIVDVLEDKEPKDFDFIGGGLDKKLDDWEFAGETKTARTYIKDKIIIQILKTSVENFDFKIGQSSYDFKHKKLTVDEISFRDKVLIPVNFEKPDRALNALSRLKHWEKKGYKMHDSTYHSLINIVAKATMKEQYWGFRS